MAASTRSTVLVCCALFAYVLVMWGEWRVMPTTTTPAASAESEASAEIAALRRRAQQLEALLAAAPKDAPPPPRNGAADGAADDGADARGAAEPAVEPYGERCFDGADDFDRAALNMFGHGLTEFSLSLSLRVAEPGDPCGELPMDSAHFHSGGCGLASGVRGFLKDRDAWWHGRRTAGPLGPRESLVAPRGNTDEDRLRRAFLDDAMAKGSRSDWGLSLARDGALLFGYGHRDFGTATDMAGTARGEARPVRDTTLRAPKGDGGADLLDGAWHDVVVARKRTSPNRKKDDVDPYGSPVTGPHCTSELYVYVDGARRAGAFAVSGGRTGDSALNNAVTKAGGSPGYKGSAPPHPLADAPLEVKLGERFRGCLRDVALHAAALEPSAVARGAKALALAAPRRPVRKAPIPLYFYSHSDAASREMRDRFVASIRDGASDVVLREWVIGASKEDQTQRFGTKIELVLRAIRENPRDSVVIVSDMDLRFYKPMAPVIDAYIGVGDPYDVDIVFQRDEDRSLQGNLGFMARPRRRDPSSTFETRRARRRSSATRPSRTSSAPRARSCSRTGRGRRATRESSTGRSPTPGSTACRG